MVDERIEKLADLSVHYSVDVKPEEKVAIVGSASAFPLINELYRACLQSDAYPVILPKLDVQYTFFKYAKDHQLKYVSPFEKFVLETVDVAIGILCEPSPKELSNVDPSKIRMRSAARSEIAEIHVRRDAEGSYRWTGLPYPVNAQAQEAEMSLPEYEDFVYGSCMVDEENPIAEWQKIHRKQEKICEFLNKTEDIRLVGVDTDLTLKVNGRKWINCSGERNLPDGEVYTAPVENSAVGRIRFTYPGIFLGREIEDIELTFKAGEVVTASAARGDEFLQQLLKIEGAKRIGEIAIGTNYKITRFTKGMLFDEKMGGTIHMALGFNPTAETGGLNKSALHWDILKDMKEGGEIYADNRLFYKDGKFLMSK